MFARYVEAVFPGEFGIKQKPWFFVTKEYWFGSQVKEPKVGLISTLVRIDKLNNFIKSKCAQMQLLFFSLLTTFS